METKDQKDRRMAWWREARFGMFIHWGVYAVLAGEWKGKKYGKQHRSPGGALMGSVEWTMKMARIPVAEYEEAARRFNPVQFDAAEWVRIAKDAGMKHIAITAKHHDGFCMYHSKVSPYNIVDFTPFQRDPIKELSEACAKQGLRLCFYYSQTQDWHHPDADGNDWDYDETRKDFAGYIENYVKPQVRELLTNYGPIGVIWFDTPKNMTAEQSQSLADLVKELQPDALVNGRVGNERGDYVSMPDRSLPPGKMGVDWESPMTMNLNWGYNRDDQEWKPAGQIIRMICNAAGRGGNVLLNVGPTADGLIPQPSVERLAQVGRWMRANGEAIHGAQASPFDDVFGWGAVTTKPGRLYLHVFRWPEGGIVIHGLKSKATGARLLGDAARAPLAVGQEYDEERDNHTLRIGPPGKAAEEDVAVVVLEVAEEVEVERGILQQPGGRIVLPGFLAQIHAEGKGPAPALGRHGYVEKWTNESAWLSWEFRVVDPGVFGVEIQAATEPNNETFETGHSFRIAVGDDEILCVADADERRLDPGREEGPRPRPDIISRAGRIRIGKAGPCRLTIKPEAFAPDCRLGLMLRSVNLTPA